MIKVNKILFRIIKRLNKYKRKRYFPKLKRLMNQILIKTQNN